MANKTIYVPITLPEEVLLESVELYARASGWDESNQLTKEEYAANKLRAIMWEQSKQYKAEQMAKLAYDATKHAMASSIEGVEQLPIIEVLP